MRENKKIKILVIDDEEESRKLIIHHLKKEISEIECEEIVAKGDFLDAIKKDHFDVVITEYHLKWGNGIEVLREVKKKNPLTPVIMFTGTGTEEVAVEAMKHGLDDYIIKSPEHFIRLPVAVNAALEKTQERVKRKEAEKALMESEEKYRMLVEMLQEGMCIDDENENIVFANDAFSNLLGYKKEELIGKNVFEIVHEEDREKLKKEGEKRRKGMSSKYELRFVAKDGSIKTLLISATPLYKEGKFIGSLSVNLDITERKRMEKAMKESQEKYRILVDNSPDGIFIVDLQGNFLSVNKAMCEVLGYSEKELLSMNIWDIVPVEYKELYKKRIARIMKGESLTEPAEYEVKAKDGKMCVVEVRSTPYIKKGKIVGFQGIARDITERKKLMKKLRDSEEKYRMLAEQSMDGIFLAKDYKLVYANPALLKILGAKSFDELKNRNLLDFLYPEDAERIKEDVERALEGGIVTKRYELRAKQPDGEEIFIDLSMSKVMFEGEPHALGMVKDITEKKKMEEALKESEGKYRTLVENAVEGIYRTTIDGKVLEVNPAVAKMFGYTQEEFSKMKNVGSTYRNPEKRKEFIEKLKKEGEVKNYEIEYVRKNGKILIATESARLTKDGIIEGIIHDITEQKEYEKKLKAIAEVSNSLVGKIDLDEIYEKSLREIIKALGADGGVIFEVKRKYLYLKKTYGISKEYRRKYKKIPIGHHLVGKVAKSGKPILIEESKKDKRATPSVIESEKYHSAIVVPIIFEGKIIGGMGIISKKSNYFSHQDIEVLQSVANQVATAINAAKLHQKMVKTLEWEREFKLRTAHYFFNPIAIAKGFLDLTMEEVKGEQRKKLKAARNAIRRVEKVVKNVIQRGEIYE